MMHNEKKTIIQGFSELRFEVPNCLLPDEQKINKKPEQALSDLYRDCSNVTAKMQITFNGQIVPEECFLVDTEGHKQIPNIENITTGKVENFQKFKQFFIDNLTEQGYQFLLQIHDQSNLGKYQFYLQQVVKQYQLIFSNSNFTLANYFYNDTKNSLILEVIVKGMNLSNLSDPEQKSNLFDNVMIGIKLIKTSDGINKIFLTDGPKILIELFKIYVQENFIKVLQNKAGFFNNYAKKINEYRSLLEIISNPKNETQFANVLQALKNKKQLDSFIESSLKLQANVSIFNLAKKEEQKSEERIIEIETLKDSKLSDKKEELQRIITSALQKKTMFVLSFQLPNLMQSAGLHEVSRTDDFIVRAIKRIHSFQLLTSEQCKFLEEQESPKKKNSK